METDESAVRSMIHSSEDGETLRRTERYLESKFAPEVIESLPEHVVSQLIKVTCAIPRRRSHRTGGTVC